MNKGGFSWKRITGVTRMKSKISRATGVPLTKSGRERKIGEIISGGGCLISVVSGFVLVVVFSVMIALAAQVFS